MKLMVNSLATWKELLKDPREKDNRRGIVNNSLILDSLSDVADYRLKDGRSVILAIHEMINECLIDDIRIYDNNEKAWNKIVHGALNPGRHGKDFLSKALGKRMLDWVYESGLMGFLPFRIILAGRGLSYLMFLSDCLDVSTDITESDGWINIIYDTLQTEALKEENIMSMLILPIYMCFRHRLRSENTVEQNNHEYNRVAGIGD